MNVSILTVFPALYDQFLQTSLIGRAVTQGKLHPQLINFFNFVKPTERIDAPTFGHSAGMLIKPEVVQKAIDQQEGAHGRAVRIFFSPHGVKLDQRVLAAIALRAQENSHLMLICGRYEGMDARVETVYADFIVSLGDFVLMGGDVPAMVLLEGLLRLLPGIVGNKESVDHDSFSGAFVDYPEYTGPVTWQGLTVPEVIRSGNHNAMRVWRDSEAINRTVKDHFLWLREHAVRTEDQEKAAQFLPSHYVVLMHDQVNLPHDRVGTTSVTSFDLHDVSRTCRTFGIKNYFMVTPLHDQQEIIKTMLNFWQEGVGIDYNKKRHEAISIASLKASLKEVQEAILEQEGKLPLLIGTSARAYPGIPGITYYDQRLVWRHERPVLFIIGTGKGLCSELLARCDYMLGPILGFSDFNHLSVRAAVSIILDRWLGINLR